MTTRKPRSADRPFPTTPALLALVNRTQELIDERRASYSGLERATSYTRQHVKNLATGRILSVSGFKALDAALGARGELLLLRDRAVAERNAARHGYALPVDMTANGPSPVVAEVVSPVGAGDSPQSPREPQEVSPVNRRDLLALLGSGATLGAVPLTPADRLVMLEKTASGDSILGVIDTQFASCVKAYKVTPPVTLLGAIQGVQGLIDRVSTQLTLRPADQAHLWHTATLTAGLRGWVHNNAGETDAARISLAEAHKRAELLDDDSLIAWTRYMQAITEDYAGNPQGAQRYADDGLLHARTAPQRALLLSDAIAGARASVGDLRGVDAAVGEARDIVTSLPPRDQGPIHRTVIDDLSTCHPVSAITIAASAYGRLGRPDRVSETVAEVRPVIEAANTHHRPYMLMDEALAVSQSKDRDLERIATLTTQGLALAAPFQSAHVGKRANAIINAVRPMKNHPAISGLIENTRSWREQQRALPA